jgi:AcrR family transcriptional regulator
MCPKVTEAYRTGVRERIIQAAIESFSQTGFDRTKMDDIADRLGLGKGTIYLYFKSKEDLFIAISDYFLRMMKGPLEAIFETKEDLISDAEQFYETFRKMGRPGDDRVVLEMIVESARNPRLKKVMHEHRLKIHDAIEGYLKRQVERGFFRKDLDTDSMAWALMALWTGQTIHKLVGVNEAANKKAWAVMIRAAYAGMS